MSSQGGTALKLAAAGVVVSAPRSESPPKQAYTSSCTRKPRMSAGAHAQCCTRPQDDRL